ncbi:transposase [Leisingera methylohalidivorans]|uniref:transposase n=1 Tax=Leisingera methylohalidivorans TaxID=133924 RepID=UPI0018D47319
MSYFGLNPRVRQPGLRPAHRGRISKAGRDHARVAAKAPDPLHAFFVRLRSSCRDYARGDHGAAG